jgi:hypothetical protein
MPDDGAPIGGGALSGVEAGAGGSPIESPAFPGRPRPIGPQPAFGIPGQSIEAPGAYFGGQPVGGPGSLFNIGGAPIAILGGVFSGGLPLGGPVAQVFRSGGPVPNTLFISTLEPSGPIGTFFIGNAGESLGGLGGLGAPIAGVREGAAPIGPGFLEAGTGLGGLSGLNGSMQRD